jgi:hypothetical protein
MVKDVDWQEIGKERSWYILRYSPRILEEALWKTTKFSVRIGGYRAEIQNQVIPNTKWEC